MRPERTKMERVLVDGRWVIEWSHGEHGGYTDTCSDAINNALICTGDKHCPPVKDWRFIKLWRLTLALGRGALRWSVGLGGVSAINRAGHEFDFKMTRHGAFIRRRIHLTN